MGLASKIMLEGEASYSFRDVADEWAKSRGIIQTPQSVTGATATISNDPSVYYECNSGSGQTLTLPAGLTAYAPGMVINIIPLGAGAVSVLAGVGVTILGATTLVSQGQYKPIQLIRTLAADTYLAVGLN